VTLGEAIRAAHERGDTAERNRLMALANQHATIRDLAALLGNSVGVTHRRVMAGRAQNPCSRLDSSAPEGTLVADNKLAPATRERPGAVAHEEQAS
jgi:hypothetical protein